MEILKHIHEKPELVQSVKAYAVSGGVIGYAWLADLANLAQMIGMIAGAILACFMLFVNVYNFFKKK